MNSQDTGKPSGDELERALAASHDGQCNHGAYYVRPGDLKRNIEKWHQAQLKADRQALIAALPENPEDRVTPKTEPNAVWFHRGYVNAIDQVTQLINGMEDSK